MVKRAAVVDWWWPGQPKRAITGAWSEADAFRRVSGFTPLLLRPDTSASTKVNRPSNAWLIRMIDQFMLALENPGKPLLDRVFRGQGPEPPAVAPVGVIKAAGPELGAGRAVQQLGGRGLLGVVQIAEDDQRPALPMPVADEVSSFDSQATAALRVGERARPAHRTTRRGSRASTATSRPGAIPGSDQRPRLPGAGLDKVRAHYNGVPLHQGRMCVSTTNTKTKENSPYAPRPARQPPPATAHRVPRASERPAPPTRPAARRCWLLKRQSASLPHCSRRCWILRTRRVAWARRTRIVRAR
jgi:hypothetical protein